jgi:hypothetical protein
MLTTTAAILTFANKSRDEPPTMADPDSLFNASKWRWADTKTHKHGRPWKHEYDLWDLQFNVSLQEPLFRQTREKSPLDAKYLVELDDNPDPKLLRPWDYMTEEQKDSKPWKRQASAQTRDLSRRDKLGHFASRWTHTNSSNPRYFADHLCQQNNLVGPDIANSHERKYCRLSDQRVFPYCEEDADIECFDFEAGAVRVRRSRILGSVADTDSPTPRTRIDAEW